MLGVSIVLFVVLLAVLFAVAAVTAGFGDLMRPVFQDARPVGLPEAKVSPDDLEALRFNVVLRGYKMTEVDAVLHRMAREIAERDAVLAELRGDHRQVSFRPPGDGADGADGRGPLAGDEPTELMAPYSDDASMPAGEPPVAPAWSPDDYRTLPLQEPTEALPGYHAGDATTLMPAVTDDEAQGSDSPHEQRDLGQHSDLGEDGHLAQHQNSDEHLEDPAPVAPDESQPHSGSESAASDREQ